MFEKVNMYHPDKVADRIAGALVDYAYAHQSNPRIAVEVLIGHNMCNIIAETSIAIPHDFIAKTVARITNYRYVASIKNQCKEKLPENTLLINYIEVPQDTHLADNQKAGIRCGDNGIFKGVPVTSEQNTLTNIAKRITNMYHSDGKYILADNQLTICQSNDFECRLDKMFPDAIVNPLGEWTGGINVDSGATNRKLGSDMGDSVTGGGLMGKDCSKADVSVNIYAWLKAQETGKPIEMHCSIGDDTVNGVSYAEIVNTALDYIKSIGGFEKFAEWGLIR